MPSEPLLERKEYNSSIEKLLHLLEIPLLAL
jgi:hypothetical protein